MEREKKDLPLKVQFYLVSQTVNVLRPYRLNQGYRGVCEFVLFVVFVIMALWKLNLTT